ncbi:hypothetical protein BHE74_00002001 [Ensete ventricosum]|nr:hypothetical protein BHE74_00002001 [Ensete ventricosum]RZR77291.1 hypothetical protein BHM03_00002306 [Ensete ventricosum]
MTSVGVNPPRGHVPKSSPPSCLLSPAASNQTPGRLFEPTVTCHLYIFTGPTITWTRRASVSPAWVLASRNKITCRSTLRYDWMLTTGPTVSSYNTEVRTWGRVSSVGDQVASLDRSNGPIAATKHRPITNIRLAQVKTLSLLSVSRSIDRVLVSLLGGHRGSLNLTSIQPQFMYVLRRLGDRGVASGLG